MDCYIQAQGHSDGQYFIDCEFSIVCTFDIFKRCNQTGFVDHNVLLLKSRPCANKVEASVASSFAPGLVISNSTSRQ